jgi:hypothetical protein
MASLQITSDPTLSVDILQDAVEEYGNELVQELTIEMIMANEDSSHDIKTIKANLTFGLFQKMDEWLMEVN